MHLAPDKLKHHRQPTITVGLCNRHYRGTKCISSAMVETDERETGAIRLDNAGALWRVTSETHVCLSPGEKEITATFQLEQFFNFCGGIAELAALADLPLFAAFKIVEKKYNDENWVEPAGLYARELPETPDRCNYQAGWFGGLPALFPLVLCGDARTSSRAWLVGRLHG